MVARARRPEVTAEEVAIEKRQRSLLDKEIEESEEKFKALARGKLGRVSLLSGAPVTVAQAAGGANRGGRGGAGSLLSGGASGVRTSPSPSPVRTPINARK